MVPAQERLDPADAVVAEVVERLEDQRQLVPRQRAAQLHLEGKALLERGVHAGLEEMIGAAPVGLGPVGGEVGILHQRLGVPAVVGSDGNPDACAEDDLLAMDTQRDAHRPHDPFGERRRILGRAERRLEDGELVAAEARDDVGLPARGEQPLGNVLQHRVADAMAVEIVDALEMVEVDEQHGHQVAACHQIHRVLHPLPELHAVGQVGQRVMTGEMTDAGFGPPLLGDVLMGRDPAAVGQRVVDHRDHPPVLKFDRVDRVLPPGGQLEPPPDIRLAASLRRETMGEAIAQDVHQRRAGNHHLGRQAVEIGEALVADDQLLLRIEHAEALRHVVDRRLEAHVLARQLGLPPFQRLDPVAFLGDVLVGRHPGAVGGPLPPDPDDPSAAEHRLRLKGVAGAERGQARPFANRHLAGGPALVIAGGDARKEHLEQRHADDDLVPVEVIKVDEALVPEDEAEVGIEQAEAVGHAVEGRIEALVLRLEVGLARHAARFRPRGSQPSRGPGLGR